MTSSVLSVPPSLPVGRAAAMLAQRGYTALPVVNDAGELVGIVSEADLIGHRFLTPVAGPQPTAAPLAAATVGEVMTTPVVGIGHDADVSAVAREMLTNHRRSLPVVDGTVLVGVITRRDIVRALARGDDEIIADVRAKLGVIGGLSRWTVRIAGGEVVLTDRYQEASDRAIAVALVESVPGVISVAVLGADRPADHSADRSPV